MSDTSTPPFTTNQASDDAIHVIGERMAWQQQRHPERLQILQVTAPHHDLPILDALFAFQADQLGLVVNTMPALAAPQVEISWHGLHPHLPDPPAPWLALPDLLLLPLASDADTVHAWLPWVTARLAWELPVWLLLCYQGAQRHQARALCNTLACQLEKEGHATEQLRILSLDVRQAWRGHRWQDEVSLQLSGWSGMQQLFQHWRRNYVPSELARQQQTATRQHYVCEAHNREPDPSVPNTRTNAR